MKDQRVPDLQDVRSWLRDRRNWHRGGDDDQVGAVNLIDNQKRLSASRTVQTGEIVALGRRLQSEPGPHNPEPIDHSVQTSPWRTPGAGYAHDYVGLSFHNRNVTHIDALCHIWDEEGMWGGKDPVEVIAASGARWGDIDKWGDGIVTRGVLLDIPAALGKEFVDVDTPVNGDDLRRAADKQGITVEPGDALVVFCGREAWEAATRGDWTDYPPVPRPGLHASCLPFIRDHDVAVLVWDQMDVTPSGYDLPWTVHGALMSFGVALVDNAILEPLVGLCHARGRYEFMVVIAPLRLPGGTGSPVNPIVVL